MVCTKGVQADETAANNVLEHIVNMADEVYEIGPTGTLVRRPKTQAPPAEEITAIDCSSSSIEATKEEASASETEEGVSSSSSITSPVLEPTVKDTAVYKMYLRSMGLGNAIIFLLLGSLFAVSFKFPGKPRQSFSSSVFSVLTSSDIWIQWWSDDASGASSKHSTGYWIGLYAGLECIPLILLALWLRYALPNLSRP